MDPSVMGTLQRFFGGRQPERDEGASDDLAPSPPSNASSGETYAAVRRERELHRLMLVEMERRGPEATAEEVYEELAARWDADHSIHPPGGTPSDAAQEGPGEPETRPAWAAELLGEQRTTNELLRRVVDLLEESRPGQT